MTVSTHIKGLLAGVATVALIGSAIAQGVPPDPTKSAPVGAGQRSTHNTPMGTTGTPGGNTGMTGSTAAGSTSAAPMPSGNANSNMGSTSMGSSSTSADTSGTGMARPMRAARADRN